VHGTAVERMRVANEPSIMRLDAFLFRLENTLQMTGRSRDVDV
jgi:hypothetical protein